MSDWARSIWPLISANVRKLYDAGAILALGTDRTVGAMVHQELESIVGLGIPPVQAIRIATLNAAVYIGIDEDLGSIEQGKLADMVLLHADPTANIRNSRSIAAVFKNGRQIDLAVLDLPVNQ